MVKVKGLGRGLDALLAGDSDDAASITMRVLPPSSLRPGRYQPRTRMDQASLAELADSIQAQGLLQPILVRPDGDGSYEIIAGERRWRAAQLAGLAEVPVLVRDIPDESALAVSLIENIQREELNALEEAGGIQRLIDDFHMTHEAAAKAVGRSRSAVTNLLRLLNLAEPVRALLLDKQIEMGHARALLGLSQERQIEVARTLARRGLSVRETEQLVTRLQSPTQHRSKVVDRDILRLQESLSDQLGTKVTITASKKGSGDLTIRYHDLDQLDVLIAKLTGAAS
jgi:ParB family transcriptional regulator, chromosome partitioning protein